MQISFEAALAAAEKHYNRWEQFVTHAWDHPDYSPQVSEFRSKYTQYNGMLQEENPLITADDVNTLKQIVVDAYDFLNGNGFDVSTVDANAAQLYRTELAGETTVDNSTNAAPAPTE